MIVVQIEKQDTTSIDHDGVDSLAEADQPPAYDTISLQRPSNFILRVETAAASSSSSAAGPSNLDAVHQRPNLNHFHSDVHKSLPQHPPSAHALTSPPGPTSPVRLTKPRQRNKGSSWLSLLPFTSARSAKQVRQSVLTIIHDLVIPPAHFSPGAPPDAHEILASAAESCADRKLSISSILQEPSIVDHTPMYWAIVNYREELLVASLRFAQPLTTQTVSDIRRACLVSSNQALFHALRVRRPPFHVTDGLRAQSLRTASDGLLLGSRPSDEVHIRESNSDGGFIATFDIVLWQKRMRAVGKVSIEFIASGRMWSITFFTTDPSNPTSTHGKSKKGGGTWHVMISILESSPPTFLDSQLIIDVPPPVAPPSQHHTRQIREARSATFTSSGDKQRGNRNSAYDYNYDGLAHSRSASSKTNDFLVPPENDTGRPRSLSSSKIPLSPPKHPLRGSILPSSSRSGSEPPIALRLRSGTQKLGRRIKSGSDAPDPSEAPSIKPDTWSEGGVSYVNAVTSPLVEGIGSRLLYDNSPYLFPDGTMRARLEARLVKSESAKDSCIIC